jgi:hypothetical protein
MSFARLSSRIGIALIASCFVSVLSPLSHAQVCPFDDGNSSLAVEGLILTRYALGITGAPLVASTGINAVDAPTVETAINCPSCGLNITGNATLTVADATIISRKLAGFSGDALTNGLALGSGTRNTPEAVQSFLLAGCGATGGTVTSITAGSGLTGGTITGSGTIAVNTAVIQNRVSGTCVVGSSIRVIAADGTVTCQTDSTGGSGTVTNVATGLGLTGGPVTTSGTISLAATQLLPTTACGNNQIPKWNGSAWLCATESVGGSGTVSSVASGTGLSGGPITATGTLSIANPYRLPQSCANGQLAKYNATTQLWECAADNGGGGTVTSVGAGIGINGGPVTTSGTLAIAPSFRLPQTCANGQFTRYNSVSDTWDCVSPVVVTNVATGPGLTGGPITTTGTLNLAATQLLPTTACANGEIAKWNSTAWACAVAASAAGTVTSVATGAGLTGGPITSTGTVSLATTQLLPTTACTTDQIIKWNGSAWVCASPGLTIPASCFAGQTLQVGAGGTVACASTPPSLSVLANLGLSSLGYAALALPADGLPVISFFDPSTSDLRVAKCGNASCSVGNTVTTVDSVGSVGGYNSVVVPPDGLPIISYLDSTNQDLKVAKCGNASCSSGNTITTVDSVFNVGFYTSIVVPADGLPVISYSDNTNQDLKVAKCGNASCSSGNTITTVDSVGNVGGDTSIAVSADGFPVISYNVFPTGLKVVKCSSADCVFGNTITLVDNVGTPGVGTSIVVPADGRPVISHYSPNLKVTKCGNASCSSGNTSTVVDNTITQDGLQSAIAISSDGLPVIAYADGLIGRLKVAKCSNASCSSGTTITTINSVDNVNRYYVPMKLSTDGKPVIVVNKTNNFDLLVLKCSDVACVNP